MSRSFNHVVLIGNLTRDPETRALPSGDEFCRFSLALNSAYTTPDGESRESVDFVDVTAWGSLASIVQTYCHKGKQIMVQGRLKSSSWEQDGQSRSKLEVRASNILLLGGGQTTAADNSRASEQPADVPSAKAKTSTVKKAKEDFASGEDYELEDLDYDQEGVNPEDIPF